MRSEAGFTLIEVLIVVGVIAVFSSLAIINLTPSPPGVDTVTDRLEANLYRASRYSIITGKAIAWSAKTGQFSTYWRGEWKPIDEWGEDHFVVEYTLDNEETGSGYVVFAPTGESSPTQIRIVLDQDTRVLKIGPTGQVSHEGTGS